MAVSSVSLNQSLIGAAATQVQAEAGQRNQNSLQTQPREDANSSSRTQLSDLGRTRLALDDLRTSTETARNLDNPPALSEFRNAVRGVVQSLNTLNQTVRTAETNTDPRPQQILNAVRSTAENTTTENGENALQRLGIATQQDGTFTVNQRQLNQSFQADQAEAQSALDELSNNLNRVAEQRLNGTTTAQPEPDNNTQQAQSIRQAIADEEAREQQRSQQETRENFRELLAAQLANAGSFSARNAVTTYFNVSTL